MKPSARVVGPMRRNEKVLVLRGGKYDMARWTICRVSVDVSLEQYFASDARGNFSLAGLRVDEINVECGEIINDVFNNISYASIQVLLKALFMKLLCFCWTEGGR